MASQLDVWNQALGHLQVSVPVVALNEASTPATACRLWEGTALDTLLLKARWTFAHGEQDLNLYRDFGAGSTYRYVFDAPVDLLEPVLLYSPSGGIGPPDLPGVVFVAGGTWQAKLPFEYRAYEDPGFGRHRKGFFTNASPVRLEYVRRVTEYPSMPPDFVLLLGLRLAVLMAPTITLGKQQGVEDSLQRKYETALSEAQRNLASLRRDSKGPRGRTPLEARTGS